MKLSDISNGGSLKLSSVTQSNQKTPASDINQGPLATSEAMQRGAISSLVGLPGDIESAVRAPFKLAGEYVGLPQQYTEALGKTYLPTTSQLEESLPGKELAAAHPIAQTVGEFIPAVVPLTGGAKIAGEPTIDIAKRLIPGATKRTQQAVENISNVTDPSLLGQRMSKSLRDRLDKLWEQRGSVTSRLRTQAFSQNDKADFVRGKMQGWLRYIRTSEGPSLNDAQKALIAELEKHLSTKKSIEGLDAERRDLEEIARDGGEGGASEIKKHFADRLSKILRDVMNKNIPSYKEYLTRYSQMSEPVNLFTDTALGKRVATDVSKRLEIPRFDPADLPKKFFKTKESIRQLYEISGRDSKFVESAAAEHAANSLDEITRNRPIREQATRAREWFEKNREWLDQVPNTEKIVEAQVKNLERTANVQRNAKYAAGAGLLLYLTHPVWALRSLMMGL